MQEAGYASRMRVVARLTHMVYRGALMPSWNRGFGSPGYCSGMSFPFWCRA